jgi:isoleucyl-tRNA synthetase
VELSSIYFDISKDILYVEAKDSLNRRANLTVQTEIFKTLIRLISPLLAYTSEEIWKFMGNNDSIHQQKYHKLKDEYFNEEIETQIETIVDVKKDVLKALEDLRKDKTIKTSQEADVIIYITDDKLKSKIEIMKDDFRRFLQLAKVVISDTELPEMKKYDKVSISVSKTTGKKCVRCWNYFDQLGIDPQHPELCSRCTDIVKNM